MTDETPLPLSSRIVLRDQTRANPRVVLLTAVDDLVREGIWRVDTCRRHLVLRERCLVAVRDLGDLPQPLKVVDRLLRSVPADARGVRTVGDSARWIARQGQRPLTQVVRETIGDMIERGFMERYTTSLGVQAHRLSRRGEAAIDGMPARGDRSQRGAGRGTRRARQGWYEPGLTPVTAGLAPIWASGFALGTGELTRAGQHQTVSHGGGHAAAHAHGPAHHH